MNSLLRAAILRGFCTFLEEGTQRHVASRVYFLRELKEQGILEVKWRTNVGMPANVLTKNVVGAQYNSKIESLVGREQYMEQKIPAVSFKKGDG